jgi:hypothetical protein
LIRKEKLIKSEVEKVRDVGYGGRSLTYGRSAAITIPKVAQRLRKRAAPCAN